MEDFELVSEFSDKLNSMVGEMWPLRAELTENNVVEKLFSTVPDKFLLILTQLNSGGCASNVDDGGRWTLTFSL